MKRFITILALTLLVALFAAMYYRYKYRYELLAQNDLAKFVQSNETELYTFYPHLIERIADEGNLASHVTKLHLCGSNFESPEFGGKDFSALTRLPNLESVECTYAKHLNSLVTPLNKMQKLTKLHLFYCDPIVPTIANLNSKTLRSLTIHSHSRLELSDDLISEFTQRMPDCELHFSTD